MPLSSRVDEKGLEGVCFFLPNLILPERLGFQPQAIVLDLRLGRWTKRLEQLIPWAIKTRAPVVALYTLGDPDAETALVNQKFDLFALDHPSLSVFNNPTRANADGTGDWRLTSASAFLQRRHRIIEIQNGDEIQAPLIACSQLLEKAAKADPVDLARVRWVIATLNQLAAPIAWFENAARSLGRSTLRRLISQIGYRSARDFEVGPILQTIRMQLETAYQTLEEEHPRARQLKAAIAKAAGDIGGDEVCCLVRDRVHAKAIKAWYELEVFGAADPALKVQLHGVSEHHTARRKCGAVIVNGALPRRYRWILGDALAPDVMFVAFQHEIDAIAAQLNQFYDSTLSTRRAEGRVRTIRRFWSGNVGPSSLDPAPSPLHLDRPAIRVKKPKKTTLASGKSFADLAALVRTVEKKTVEAADLSATSQLVEADEEPAEMDATGDSTDGVLSLRVDVESQARGTGCFYFPCNSFVECVKPSEPERLLKVAPRELAIGDVLPQVDEHGRTSVFESLIGLLDEQPTMRPVMAARRQWQIAIERLIAQRRLNGNLLGDLAPSLDYSKLLQDLQAVGATIHTEQAVRSWVTGQTIGPDSVGSIRAVGKVAGVEAVSKNAADLDRAFRKIRGVHQSVGRRLAGALRRSFKRFGTSGGSSTLEDLDEHLRLPLTELIESVDFVEVLGVSPEPVLVSSGATARFRASAD